MTTNGLTDLRLHYELDYYKIIWNTIVGQQLSKNLEDKFLF